MLNADKFKLYSKVKYNHSNEAKSLHFSFWIDLWIFLRILKRRIKVILLLKKKKRKIIIMLFYIITISYSKIPKRITCGMVKILKAHVDRVPVEDCMGKHPIKL